MHIEIINKPELIHAFKRHINAIDEKHGVSDIILRRSLDESWFSNTLAWLLDPKASHGLGVRFANEFLKMIAQKRSAEESTYARRKTHLKFGKSGPGVTPGTLSISNSTVLREFYFSGEAVLKTGRGARYCDIAFVDLGADDSIFLVIENKLFTTDSAYQLEDYYLAVEDKFGRAKVREYVYLTMNGQEPSCKKSGANKKYFKHWILVSWIDDVRLILEKFSQENTSEHVVTFYKLLCYLKDLSYPDDLVALKISKLKAFLLQLATDCLHEELKRLGEGMPGEWKSKSVKTGRSVLWHTSVPKRKLIIEINARYYINVYGTKKGAQQVDKILIPFGAHPEQVFYILDIAARDIYHQYFDDPSRYLSNKKRLTKTLSELKSEYLDFLKFVYKYKHELQVLLAISAKFWSKE